MGAFACIDTNDPGSESMVGGKVYDEIAPSLKKICIQKSPPVLVCAPVNLALQEKQLEEAAKNNEEAQAVIIQLNKSLAQLENRYKQARKET